MKNINLYVKWLLQCFSQTLILHAKVELQVALLESICIHPEPYDGPRRSLSEIKLVSDLNDVHPLIDELSLHRASGF